MDIISRYQIYHLDDLRKRKKISVEALCSDICTDRQYRRYLNGENILQHSKLVQFCLKLNISVSDFYYSMYQKDRYLYSRLAKIYNLLTSNKFSEAKEEIKTLKNTDSYDHRNKKLYIYIKIRVSFELNETGNNKTLKNIKNESNYDMLIQNSAFDFVDILFLQLITRIEISNKNTKTLEILKKLLSSDENIYISSENKYILAPIYSNLSIFLGKLNRIYESREVAVSGIAFCNKNNISDALPNLYYSKMLCDKSNDNKEEMYLSAVQCLSACISSKEEQYWLFYDLIKRYLKIDPVTLYTQVKIPNI